MSSPYEERVAQLMERYGKVRERTLEARARMREISCTVTAPRQVVAVTVGRHGVVTGLKFPTGTYKRMAPNELADIILKTFHQAREQALDEAAEIMRPMLPEGFDSKAMMSGDADFEQLLPTDPQARRGLFDGKLGESDE